MQRRYITQWQAKQAQIRIKNQTISTVDAIEVIEGCFHVIRDVIPILKERSEMGCLCECPTPCRCGKEAAIEILRRLDASPHRKI